MASSGPSSPKQIAPGTCSYTDHTHHSTSLPNTYLSSGAPSSQHPSLPPLSPNLKAASSSHGRRVRFTSEVRRSYPGDLREGSSSKPEELISPFKTPPIVVTPEHELGFAYFDTDHRSGVEGEDQSTSLPTDLGRGRRRSRQKTFKEEVRAALEGTLEGLSFDAISLKDKQNLMAMLGSCSAPASAQGSPVTTPRNSQVVGSRGGAAPENYHPCDISTLDLEKGLALDTDPSDDTAGSRPRPTTTTEAHKLVRAHTQRNSRRNALGMDLRRKKSTRDLESGASTPSGEGSGPSHDQIRSGVLSSLLKLYNNPNGSLGAASTPNSPPGSGISTPKWYSKSANNSTNSLAGLGLVGSNQALMAAGTPMSSRATSPSRARPPKYKRRSSGLSGILKQIYSPKQNIADEIRITIHIAQILSRQKYVLKLCKALMLYGAPTHRLEEYMRMTCRVLEIDGQFLYIPGCMVVSFDDPSTHTSDMRIVRVTQGCDLGKLHDTHLVYKAVVHDKMGVDEAIQKLDGVIQRPPKHPVWLLVLVYGLASALVGPFAFQARPIDMPISFLLGCILGILQLVVAPRSDMYTNVLEISATVIMSFLARAFGSLRNGELFCFSALTQSSIALILPGYIILCGSLELQSKNIVAGSVRMFYAIIYSLFLGFGITVGATLYGALDKNATSATTCQNPLPKPWSFLFVPFFSLCLLVVVQAKWRQAPVMVAIATLGYTVNYFSMQRFASSPQVVSCLGALAIGVLGNLYSRVGHGLAFAAMLPAVFVQVPSGLAAQGSIISGIENADALARNYTMHTQDAINSTVLNLGFSMIQISIGLTVGLFATVLLLYPFGKKRSGLFTF